MGDLISRQAAIDVMCELVHQWFEDSENEAKEISRELGKLTSIQSKPKKGEWIPVYKHFSRLYTCSCCGEWRYHPEPYCGHCGADMREEKTNED